MAATDHQHATAGASSEQSAPHAAAQVPGVARANQSAAARLLGWLTGADAPVRDPSKPIFGAGRAAEAGDVEQGNLDDCWFLAPLIAMVRADPGSVERLIHDRGDGSYDVTLYLDPDGASSMTDGVAGEQDPARKTPRTFHVTAAMLGASDRKGVSTRWAHGDKDKLWVAIMEQALVLAFGGYPKLEDSQGGRVGSVGHSVLSPGATQLVMLRQTDLEALHQRLSVAIAGKAPVTTGSLPPRGTSGAAAALFTEDDYAVAANYSVALGHDYAVRAIDLDAKTISLTNPQGVYDLNEMPLADFERVFEYVVFGQASKT